MSFAICHRLHLGEGRGGGDGLWGHQAEQAGAWTGLWHFWLSWIALLVMCPHSPIFWLTWSPSGSAQEADSGGDCSVAQFRQAAQDYEEDRQMAGRKKTIFGREGFFSILIWDMRKFCYQFQSDKWNFQFQSGTSAQEGGTVGANWKWPRVPTYCRGISDLTSDNGLALNVPSNRQTTWPLRLTRNRLKSINLERTSTPKGSQSLRPLLSW